MKNFFLSLAVILALQLSLNAQESINNYKYVIIPAKYDFLSKPDLYQLNSLTKFLFNKYGYTAFIEGEDLPAELNVDRCKAMRLDVTDEKGGIFKTKLQMHLKDCDGNIITSSKVGETREKELATAYNLALRDAFESFREIDYAYSAAQNVETINDTEQKKIAQKEQESKQKNLPNKANDAQSNNVDKEVETNIDEEDEIPSVVVSSVPIDNEENKTNAVEASPEIILEVLYAQPMMNGFQVVDTSPKKIMFLLKTEIKDVFLVKGKDAMVFNKEGKWYYSEMNDTLETKELNIKF